MQDSNVGLTFNYKTTNVNKIKYPQSIEYIPTKVMSADAVDGFPLDTEHVYTPPCLSVSVRV